MATPAATPTIPGHEEQVPHTVHGSSLDELGRDLQGGGLATGDQPSGLGVGEVAPVMRQVKQAGSLMTGDRFFVSPR